MNSHLYSFNNDNKYKWFRSEAKNFRENPEKNSFFVRKTPKTEPKIYFPVGMLYFSQP